MTIGIAKMIMNDVTSDAQTNSGMCRSVMPGRAQLQDGRRDVDRDHQAHRLAVGDRAVPDVDALADPVLGPGERHVGEPAGVRPRVGEERAEQQQAAEEKQPVRAGGHARERDVARADHQRHQVEREALHHRHGEQEHHRRAVHREELVVEVRADEMAVRGRELMAHQPAHHAGRAEEAQRRDDEAQPDGLVTVGLQEADDAGLVGPRALELARRRAIRRPRRRADADGRRFSFAPGCSRVLASPPSTEKIRSRPSLQRPEISGNRDEIRRRGGQRRHVDAGLVLLGIGDPVRARGGGVLQRAGGERRAASDVGEIGRAPSLAPRSRKSCGTSRSSRARRGRVPAAPAQWTAPWPAGAERRASVRNRRARPRRRPAPCARAGSRRIPRIGRGRCPRMIGAKRDRRLPARDQVLLAGEARHPEAVDDVVGAKAHQHRPSDRHVKLVGRREGHAQDRSASYRASHQN